MKTNLSISSEIKHSDYYLLREFYGRDLGGESYFSWKHYSDKRPPEHRKVFYFEANNEILGVIIATCYCFYHNHLPLSINMIGDLGVSQSVDTSHVVKKLLISAHCFDVDASVCFSDDRKISVYNSFFKRKLNTINQVIPYDELILQTFSANESYTRPLLESLNMEKFVNNFGRVKDKFYIEYLKQHPSYRKIFAIENMGFIAIFGLTADYVEVLDISGTSSEQFRWAIRASHQFHERCKILLPRSRSPLLYQGIGTPLEIKQQNMMISWYALPKYTFDPDNIWICRLDRR